MKGVFTALVTPFLASGEIDTEGYKKLLKQQKAGGVTGVIPCGTTGEAPTLSIREKQTLIQLAVEEFGQTGVVAGTGSNNTAETVELSRWASRQGVRGVLVVTPYYNKPTKAGLEAHFLKVADSVDCEVMLYNVPGRTGVSLTPESVAKLAKHSRIRSIKEATGNPAFASEIVIACREAHSSIDILSGDDLTYVSLCAIGAVGVVSVISNLFPAEMCSLQKFLEQGDYARARSLHDALFPLFRNLFVESNPGPIKFLTSRAIGFSAALRLPLVEMSAENCALLVRTEAETKQRLRV